MTISKNVGYLKPSSMMNATFLGSPPMNRKNENMNQVMRQMPSVVELGVHSRMLTERMMVNEGHL